MQNNKNLHTAKVEKNDEFYTRIEDVEAELKNYAKHFAGKIVYCNFDDPSVSAFWQYFHQHFSELGLKKLIATHINLCTKAEYAGGNDADINDAVVTDLQKPGDFRSPECIELLKEADIICTNPAFSLFRQLIKILVENGKDFLIISNKNAITYKEFFPLLKDNKAWLGMNNVKAFVQPDGSIKKFGNIGWFTNLDIPRKHAIIPLTKKYNPASYLKYDDFDAINVSRVADIPCDYYGQMGVPITYMVLHNPDQFEILGNLGSYGVDGYSLASSIHINGKKVFKRILIRRTVTP